MALELVSNNISRETRAGRRHCSAPSRWARRASSDAHDINVVGCYFTEFDVPIDSIADFVAALRNKRGHRAIGRVRSLPAGL